MLLSILLGCALKVPELPPPAIDIQPYRTEIDWTAVEQEAAQLLSAYVQVDTTNPSGNETEGAIFLGQVLAEAEIEYEIHESSPGRGNLIARLEGGDAEKPLCLLSHIDVVTAEPDKWPEDKQPLSGVISDGYIWGRGTLDMKGMGIMELMTMLLLKRQNVPLKRDVILIAVADEEVGGEGMQFLVDTYWDYLDCGQLINEGGLGLYDMLFEGQTVYPISVGEKGSLWLKMSAHGEAGHGSTPRPNEAPQYLLEALEALEARPIDAELSPSMQTFLASIGAHQGGAAGFVMQRPALANRLVKPKLMENPLTRAAVINTVHLTGLDGSNKPNVVPSEVSALLDCRLQPAVEPEEFLAWLKTMVGPNITFEVLGSQQGNLSDWDDPLYRALVRAATEDEPQSVAGPVISVGFTDSIYVRPMGTKAYGFVPIRLTAEDMTGFHGAQERLSVSELGLGTKKLYSAVLEVSAEGPSVAQE